MVSTSFILCGNLAHRSACWTRSQWRENRAGGIDKIHCLDLETAWLSVWECLAPQLCFGYSCRVLPIAPDILLITFLHIVQTAYVALFPLLSLTGAIHHDWLDMFLGRLDVSQISSKPGFLLFCCMHDSPQLMCQGITLWERQELAWIPVGFRSLARVFLLQKWCRWIYYHI